MQHSVEMMMGGSGLPGFPMGQQRTPNKMIDKWYHKVLHSWALGIGRTVSTLLNFGFAGANTEKPILCLPDSLTT